ncbi:MAG: elongation factor G [Chloroflexi bacterium]|nr:elongation factor G [Chloroflexota bacterium]
MKKYETGQLVNVSLVGHGSSGKTTLTEAMLFATGAINRLGRVEDGTTVSDYDPEEQERKMSVNTSIVPCEWNDRKVNVLDTPGYTDFVGEVKGALRVADSMVSVICAASGVEVGTELTWQYADEQKLPRMVFINKMDRENASFDRTLEHMRQKFDQKLIPLMLPIGSQAAFAGVVDVLAQKAYTGASGEAAAIPADLRARAEELRQEAIEAAAESDDELVMKYLDGEELTADEIQLGIRKGVANGSFVPVFCGSATLSIGVKPLLDAMTAYLPSPAGQEVKATNPATGEVEALKVAPDAPLTAIVFKTLADPFVGKMTFFRVASGILASDSRVFNSVKSEEERVGQLYYLRGKEQITTDAITAGDLGIVTKLGVTSTGDTLCDRAHPLVLAGISYPSPIFEASIAPKTKADLDRMSNALARLVDEDPTVRLRREQDTGEMIVAAMGESHVDIAVRRLARKFGVQVVTDVPQVPYRETVTRSASAQGRHKKQTGGRGQFGDVWLRVDPLPAGSGYEFANEVFGGSVPKNYIPSVEKGLQSAIQSGVLAGYPVTDVKIALYDGSYHPVDSSDIAFQLAAQLGFRKVMESANPVLLEPIMNVRIVVPEQFMGDVLGDLNTRRARVQGMDQEKGNSIITAQAPLAEMQRYSTNLRAMTQGRGFFSMEFTRYEQVPSLQTAAIVEKAKKAHEAEA